MKIIGQTEGGFLVSTSQDEIANLLGYYYGSAAKCPIIKPGMEIQVSKMYKQLYELAAKSDAMSKTAAELRAIADMIEVKNPLINAATKPAQEETA